MKKVKLSLIAIVLLATLAGCTPDDNPDIKRLAMYYAERMRDSLPADSTDSTRRAPLLSTAAIDSITATWTAADWQRFWSQVEKAKPKESPKQP